MSWEGGGGEGKGGHQCVRRSHHHGHYPPKVLSHWLGIIILLVLSLGFSPGKLAKLLSQVLWTKCLCALKICMLKPQYDGIWSWGLCEIIRVR